jgi:hypothetical protein
MYPLKILRLDLYAPLFYSKDMGLKPFEYTDLLGENLFCFEIDPAQSLSIEPEKEHYLGNFVCGGVLDPEPSPSKEPEIFELPTGKYIFAQVQDILNQEKFIWMAMEVQKQGLREGASLENRLYLRYLFEDGKGVTQVFRPLAPG